MKETFQGGEQSRQAAIFDRASRSRTASFSSSLSLVSTLRSPTTTLQHASSRTLTTNSEFSHQRRIKQLQRSAPPRRSGSSAAAAAKLRCPSAGGPRCLSRLYRQATHKARPERRCKRSCSPVWRQGGQGKGRRAKGGGYAGAQEGRRADCHEEVSRPSRVLLYALRPLH